MKKVMMSMALATSALLSGCVTFPTMESEQVNVVWDDINAIQGCEHKGTVIGSEGHFYDFWLHADKDMVWGALNQMRAKAAEKGGNVLYLYQPLSFSTSVTMFGNAYACDLPSKNQDAEIADVEVITETNASLQVAGDVE